jgi:hypothetical protein
VDPKIKKLLTHDDITIQSETGARRASAFALRVE